MLLELIKDKRVAIVGPSSFLNNKKMGVLIDSYDIVIKLNKFEVLSPIDYGKKTDILFFTYAGGIPSILIKNYNIKLIVASGRPRNLLNRRINKIEESKKMFKVHHEFYPEEELSSYMKNFIFIHRPRKSLGFWIICLLFDKIDMMKELGIFGIDFCFNRYNPNYSKKNICKYHDMELELFLFKEIYQKYKNKKIVIYDEKFLSYLHEQEQTP